MKEEIVTFWWIPLMMDWFTPVLKVVFTLFCLSFMHTSTLQSHHWYSSPPFSLKVKLVIVDSVSQLFVYLFLFKWNNSSMCLFIWGFIWIGICWIWCICRYLKNKLPTDEQKRFHFFNSFFFRKLADLDKDPSSVNDGRAAFQRVRKWTRKVNLFEKDYILIPINYR
jgi:hypothetical protein